MAADVYTLVAGAGVTIVESVIDKTITISVTIGAEYEGSNTIVSVGTVSTGTWNADPIAITYGGTGQATKTAGFDALSPNSTLGDLSYHNGTNNVRLAGNTSATRKFLRQVGNGVISAAMAWDTVTASDVGLGSVEDTALSTWAGSTNVTTVGTVSTGTWNATTIGISKGGTGQTAKADAYNALSPNSTLGDVTYHNGSNNVRLAGNTTATKKVLAQTGNGSVSAAPEWLQLASTDLSDSFSIVMTSGTQTVGGAKTFTTVVSINDSSAADAVTNSGLTVQRDASANVNLITYVSSASGSFISARKARGTAASPSAVNASDAISTWNATQYGATGFLAAATVRIQLIAQEASTDSAGGTAIRFGTTPIGSVTIANVAGINAAGNLFLGNPTNLSDPASKVFVYSDAASAPHLTVRQQTADTTGPRIELNKTRGTTSTAVTRPNSGDNLGEVAWVAPDGSSAYTIAKIRVVANATTGTGDLPTAMVLSTTPDGTTTLTDAVTVDQRQNIVVSAAGTAGATAQKNVVLSNSAVEATSSVDLVHLYAKDISAGNCALGIYAEAAINVDAAAVSTHSIPVYYNGVAYKVLVKT